MKTKGFTCPNCGEKQKIGRLLIMSNFSKWNCHKCGVKIAPERQSPIHGLIGFISAYVPTQYCLYQLNYSIWKSMGIGVLFTLISLSILYVYLYKNVKLIFRE